MRFEFTSSGSRSVLRAVFEEGDRTEGPRQEGVGATIVYSGTFDFCDDRWRPAMRERVLEHLDPMRPEDITELETWNGARRARGRGAGRFASMLRRTH